MINSYSFGEWLKQRRKQLKLTQREVATAVYCSTPMIKKIEADERQPSVELAQSLAVVLKVPSDQQDIFVECARGERPLDHLVEERGGRGAEEQGRGGAGGRCAPSLPTPATSFIGRQAELADITAKLCQPNCRLLTLLAPGGMGKTRLAIEAARQVQVDFADGVVFVDLTAVTDPTLIPDSIAHALNLSLPGPADKHLPRVLRQRQMLILLDNCEQLGDGLAWLSILLADAPNITLLATSRERLQLAEEWVFSVAGLDAALELFGQTAVRVKPNFDVSGEKTAVHNICQLVENLPLAVELAASWTPFLTCAQIAAHIQTGLDILVTTVRNIPARHRSMQAVFDASWHLLTETERNVLMRLSVFRGGWRVEEATAVARANLFLLRGLAEKSLVRVGENGRFHIHELTRQYAAAQLQAADAEKETCQQHANIFFALAQRFEQTQPTPEGAALFQQVQQEFHNIEAALQWFLDSEQSNQALQLAGNLGFFWFGGGHRLEGVRWLETILAGSDQADSIARCAALLNVASLLPLVGREQDAANYMAQVKPMAYRLEDPFLLTRVLFTVSLYLGDREEAKRTLEEALPLFDLIQDERKGAIVPFYGFYGDLLRETGYYADAKAYYQKAEEVRLRYGFSMADNHTGNFGRLALQEGNLPEAYALVSEQVENMRQLRHHKWLADWLVRLGEIETYLGEWSAAQTHLQECFQLMEAMADLRGQTDVLAGLGYLALQRGEVATAVAHMQKCLHWYAEITPPTTDTKVRDLTPELIDAILRAGLAAAANQQPAQAATLFAAVTRFATDMHHFPPPPLAQAMEEAVTAVRAALSSVECETAVIQAQQLTLNQLLAVW
ncbi:MAG TPA: helix-turn-helix domain-containing protein [Chloroflexota bacterium]|nr:helix-turn-helix domain-containing protein [Chloroflexota bacterium]HUM67700.1 helix-turn-helix domain-containing protein [Chloroflexota bacterium]